MISFLGKGLIAVLISVQIFIHPVSAQNIRSEPSETGALSPSPSQGTSVQNSEGGGWNAEVAPSSSPATSVDLSNEALVKVVSNYFNGINSITGNFIQTTSDQKRMKGKFSLLRPGKFRFDYALPSKQVIISDGQYIAIQDHDLNNEDRVELDQTPFRLLLRKEVDLARDARITELSESEDAIILALQDKNPDAPGRIKLTLSKKPELQLKDWITTDAQGQDTRIEITEFSKGEKLNPSLFAITAVTANPLRQ